MQTTDKQPDITFILFVFFLIRPYKTIQIENHFSSSFCKNNKKAKSKRQNEKYSFQKSEKLKYFPFVPPNIVATTSQYVKFELVFFYSKVTRSVYTLFYLSACCIYVHIWLLSVFLLFLFLFLLQFSACFSLVILYLIWPALSYVYVVMSLCANKKHFIFSLFFCNIAS